ncbi:MAG: threonine synthase [Saprospiraceae bacterium]|nr:threonine synthase [Saprospiraceae bacterium]
MTYYSLHQNSAIASFKQATLLGQAPDKGLYFPAIIPAFEPKWLKDIEHHSNEAIAFETIQPFIGDEIDKSSLQCIVQETINFPIPLIDVTDQIAVLELFHGPTHAFKDVGARFMSRCLGYFTRETHQKAIVLVATSGDTGGAVAHGFYNVEGVDVLILYPSGKVSAVQEKQLTTLGKNIHALEVDGTFDDCQQMVKTAFADTSFTGKLFLTSANSINVARWLPQQIYYLLAWKQWKNKSMPPVFSVPSGNFGNICAGMLAFLRGMPAHRFIAACNANDTVPSFMETNSYQPKPAVATLSNAMDVSDPSNFVRILALFHQSQEKLRQVLSAVRISDEETRTTLRRVHHSTGYTLDPHGAVGYLALERYLNEYPEKAGIFLETAHPIKFYNVVEPVINSKVPMPESVKGVLELEKKSVMVEADYLALKAYLIRSYS